jgi:hypothetical protein
VTQWFSCNGTCCTLRATPLHTPHTPRPSRDLPQAQTTTIQPLEQVPKRSDLPNWREAHPGRPISFRNPSPPPSEPSSPKTTTFRAPEITPIIQQQHPEPRLGSKLISLIKTTTEALQSIIRVAERLVRQVNAERRLAHKSQRTTWSLREDTHGNTARSRLPVFPSGRGVPVTGSLGDSEAIA